MPQSSRAWEKSSQRGPPFDPPEPVQITVELTATRNRKREINQYWKEARIGKGRHGEVYMCHLEEDMDRKVAMKIVKRSNPRDKIKLLRRNYQQSETTFGTDRPYPMNSTENSIRKEIAIMKKCRHPNIVQLFEVIDDPRQEKIFMVMEYCPGGPVQWATEAREPILRLEQIRRIMRDVVVGLEYLHSLGIIHRDIKPSNLLYSQDRTIVKIIDFGVSHYNSQRSMPQFASRSTPEDASLFPDSDLQKTLGTPNFLAPEVVWFDDSDSDSSETDSNRSSVTVGEKASMPKARPPITEALDIWALGVTFYCLLFGQTPFSAPASTNDNIHHNEWMLYNQICTQDWEVGETMTMERIPTGGRHPKDATSQGHAAISLLDSMLQKNPLTRITASNLKRHPWMLTNLANPKEWLQLTSPCPVPNTSTSTPKTVLPICRWLYSLNQRLTRLRFK
ncbi:hypothetical protein NP233_g4516 [Leucocoprinus birnbaumii]|uniref:Protein kinase domain-containing protein n=1 Tax=Leucocoprinus birnbaumii TaxID=56174 RepID=A0AAD5VUJ6_9AGAR|nr:hypothetical protein NP233_g4516 [Leucocoprinus birnbaumii]